MWRFFRKNAQSIPIMKYLLTGLCALLGTAAMAQQSPTVRYANRLTPVQQYVCQRTPSPLHIDGRLDEAAWHILLTSVAGIIPLRVTTPPPRCSGTTITFMSQP